MNRRPGLPTFALVIGASFVAAIPAEGRQPQLPTHVHSALVASARSLTPIRITLEEHYTSRLSPARLAAQLESPVDRLFRSRIRTLARDGVALYQRTDEVVGSGWETREAAFDGVIYYNGEPTSVVNGRPRPELCRRLVARLSPQQRLWDVDYFADAGFEVPRTASELLAHEAIKSRVLSLLDRGGRLQEVSQERRGDRDTVLVAIASENPLRRRAQAVDVEAAERELRSIPGKTEQWVQEQVAILHAKQQLPESIVYTFTLDPIYNFAVTRLEERYPDGTLLRGTTNSELQQVGDRNVWLPRRSKVEFYTYDSVPHLHTDAPLLAREMAVQGGFQTSPLDPGTFVLSYSMPGTLVIDETLGEQRMVTVAAPAAPPDPAAAHERDRQDSRTSGRSGGSRDGGGDSGTGPGVGSGLRQPPTIASSTARSWLPFIGLCAAAGVLIAGWVWRRGLRP